MRLQTLKRTIATTGFGLIVLLGVSGTGIAQRNQRNNQQNKQIEKQRQQIQKQNDKIEKQRRKDLEKRQNQTRIEDSRQQNNRYRIYRNGRYYNTDNRGAELLRNAIRAGYRQGYAAGKRDRNSRRSNNWGNNSIYRNGNYGYQNYVDSNQYQYYFRQGFQRGYQDGYNSRNQYGYNNGGSSNILVTILNSILNIRQY